MARGLMIRMESAGPNGEDAEESLAVNADAAAATEEVESASGDVTEIDTGIDNAMEAKDELGEVTDLVQESVDDGEGLSPREAAHVEARLEHIARLLGTTAKKQGLTFRRESFGGTSSRLAATKMRLESLKEFASGIWEAIKRGWEWLKDAVKNLWAKITQNSAMIEKRFEDLEARLNALTGSVKCKNEKMKASAKIFSINGKTDQASINTILDTVEKSNDVITKFLEGSKNLVNGETNSDSVEADIVYLLMEDLVQEAVAPAGAKKISGLPKGYEKGSAGFGYWPGNKTLLLVPVTKNAGGQEIKTAKISFEDANEKAADDYTAFKKEKLVELCKKGVTSAAELIKLEKSVSIIEKNIDLNINFCLEQQKLAHSFTKATTETTAEVKAAKKQADYRETVAQTVSQASKTLTTKIPTMFFQAVSGLSDMIDAGISNLKEEKDKK